MLGWAALALAVALPQQQQQEEARVTASLSTASVTAGTTVTLEIRVETPGVRAVRMNIPPLPPSLDIVSTQDFTHDQLRVPGGRTRIVQRSLVLLPSEAGTFLIPTIPVDVDGTTYRTAPLRLDVLPGAPPARGDLTSAPDDIRLFASLDRDTIYVGEQAVLEVEALFPRDMRQRQTRPATFETPNPPGFWISELPGGLTGGVRLFRGDVVETQRYRRVYVPLEPGRHVLDPVRLRYEVRRGQMYATEQREQVSDSLRVLVLPLPEQGRPASFTGAVGRYRAKATLTPPTVAAGDAATLRVEIEGTGNVKTLPPPPLPKIDGVEIFPPTEDADVTVRGDRLGGTKRFTWVLVPERDGPVDLGAIEYAFFDPETGRYGVSRTEPVHLAVNPAPDGRRTDPADTALSRIRAVPSPAWGFVHSPLFLAAQAVPLLALLLVVALRRRDGTAPEPRTETARWEADLEALLSLTVDDRTFLGRLSGVVRHALEEIAGSTGLRAARPDRVVAELQSAGVSHHAAQAAAALLGRIDHARFADTPEGQDRARWVAESRGVLGRIESTPRPGAALPLILLLLLLPATAAAQSETTFRGGVGSYLQGDYATAVHAFEQYVADAPSDAAAWYNLGNAYRGTGDIGRAVLAWRRSLELEPRSGATRRNLEQVGGAPAMAGAPMPIALTTAELILLLSALWWIGTGAALVTLWRGDRRWLRISVGAGVAAVLALVLWFPHALGSPAAIALDDAAPLLAGPALRSDTVAVVPAGTAVQLVGREANWLRVRTSDHAEGWAAPERFAEVRAVLDP